MLQIIKDTTNLWACECNELAVLGHYLFVFRDLQTNIETIEYLNEDLLTDRYIQFEIIDGTTLDLTEGEYEYRIFDGDGTSENYSTMTLLEVGKLIVK